MEFIRQSEESYRIAKAQHEKKELRLNALFMKGHFDAFVKEMVSRHSFMQEVNPDDMEERLLDTLKKLRHHDEYFTILNLKTMQLEWCFGLKNLGYNEEDEKTWNFKKQHFCVHDDYYPMFVALGGLANAAIRDLKIMLRPLGPRYIINLPLRKKNGNYVWVKQMSLPLSVDSNGVMVRQLNSYTIVSGFEGVSLPLLPRIYYEDGKRATNVEKWMFEVYVAKSLFELTPTHKRVAMAAYSVWKEKIKADQSGHLKFELVKHKDIADFMVDNWPKKHEKVEPETVRNHVNEMRARLKKSFDIRFETIVEIAIFLKALYYLENV